MDKDCIFISSSDNTIDVFEIVSQSYSKNINLNSFDLLVGCNAKKEHIKVKQVLAEVSQWNKELLAQLNKIQSKYILLLLDDFYIYEFDNKNVSEAFSYSKEYSVDYLRIVKESKPFLISFFSFFFHNRTYKKINKNLPYYCALQPSIWKVEYLTSLLKKDINIWEFEEQIPLQANHMVVAKKSLIKFDHLVEKGKWKIEAPKILGLPKETFISRGFDQRLLKKYRVLRKIYFGFFGFTGYRLRKIISKYR